MTGETLTRSDTAARLRVGDKEIDLPAVRGTDGDPGLDIGRLRAETGYITLDPGYGNTGSCTSAITYLDGERGILRYRGYPYIYPRNDLGYAANLLHMMFSVPAEAYEVDPQVAEALDLLLILHADHEQNCSTSTVRMVGSAQTNLYASIGAGIAALWGPLHGGANQ